MSTEHNPVLESELAEAEITDGPENVNESVALTEIHSLFERAFEDSKRDVEEVYIYTSAPNKDAAVSQGIVVAYDSAYVVLVEGAGKFGVKQQQQIVRRDSIVMMRSAYNMLAHT